MNITIKETPTKVARKTLKPNTIFKHPGSSIHYCVLGLNTFNIVVSGVTVECIHYDLETGTLYQCSGDSIVEPLGQMEYTR